MKKETRTDRAKSSQEQSYIVRVYRRTESDTEQQRRNTDQVEVIGTVEGAGTGEQQQFRNVEELWRVLQGCSVT